MVAAMCISHLGELCALVALVKDPPREVDRFNASME